MVVKPFKCITWEILYLYSEKTFDMRKSHVGKCTIILTDLMGLQKSKSLQGKALYLGTSYQGKPTGGNLSDSTCHNC
jgi:hypothetical protein